MNEFVARNGLIALDSSSISGSLTVSGSANIIGGPLTVTGSVSVMGNTLLKGSGSTSATTALSVQNSSSQNILRVLNNGQTTLTGTTSNDTTTIFRIEQNGGNGRFLVNAAGQTIIAGDNFQSSETFVSIERNAFNPTSGGASHTSLRINPTINQTGGANGITRGLYVNPTLNAAADWRSIEWSNNASIVGSGSWGLYGAGSAPNYLSGSLGIGTTSISASLHISGSTGGLLKIDSNVSSNILYVSSSGNIGIGTNTPIYKLDVSGTSRLAGDTLINSANGLTVSTTVSSTPIIINAGGSATAALELQSLSARRFRILSTSATTTFEATNTSGFVMNSNLNVQGNVTGSSFTGSFTGSLLGTASFAVSASWAPSTGGGSITVGDEGTTQGTATYFNFIGAGVTATVSSNTASITIPGGGGGGTSAKAGSGSAASFTGTPRTSAITFGSAFSDNLYAVTVTGEDARSWTIQSKSSTGFTINSNSSVALTGPVYWIATAFN